MATVLVQSGTLKVGDDFIVGLYSGRVRALLDERGKQVKQAGPAIPVQVLGLTGVPMAGDEFRVVDDATQAREIAQRRERLDREAKSRRTSKSAVTLEDFMSQTAAGEKRTLRVLIKADQGGPAEALADALAQLSNAEVQVEVIHRGVGAVTESDILLARAAGAIIVGFHVRPDNNARAAADREGVDIKLYKVIYDAVNDVRAALEGMLRPEEREVVLGEAEVRQTFKAPKVGVVAGCLRSARHDHSSGTRARHSQRRRGVRRHDRLAPPLQGRRPRGEGGLRVRYLRRELQRHQGRRRHRVLSHRGSRAHPAIGVHRAELDAGPRGVTPRGRASSFSLSREPSAFTPPRDALDPPAVRDAMSAESSEGFSDTCRTIPVARTESLKRSAKKWRPSSLKASRILASSAS